MAGAGGAAAHACWSSSAPLAPHGGACPAHMWRRWWHVALGYVTAPVMALPVAFGCGLTDWDVSSTMAKLAIFGFAAVVGLQVGGGQRGLVRWEQVGQAGLKRGRWGTPLGTPWWACRWVGGLVTTCERAHSWPVPLCKRTSLPCELGAGLKGGRWRMLGSVLCRAEGRVRRASGSPSWLQWDSCLQRCPAAAKPPSGKLLCALPQRHAAARRAQSRARRAGASAVRPLTHARAARAVFLGAPPVRLRRAAAWWWAWAWRACSCRRRPPAPRSCR